MRRQITKKRRKARKYSFGGSRLRKSKKHGHKKTKKTENTGKFVKLNCSPENKNKHSNLNAYTCYSDEDLHKLRDIWNARHPNLGNH